MSVAKRESATDSSTGRASKTLDAKESGRGARSLYVLTALLALAGLADALYLTINHLTGRQGALRCTAGGCSDVLGSVYATLGPLPVASLGALAYFGVFSLATLALFDYLRARSLLFILVALMLGMTLWLLFVQAFILHKFCDYCLLSAAITISLSAIMIVLRFRLKDQRAAR